MTKKLEYEIYYTKIADKFLKKHESIRDEYEDCIKRLILNENISSIDLKKIKGKRGNYYRIKINKYRIIYTIVSNRIVVVYTMLAGNRGDVYKKMSNIK